MTVRETERARLFDEVADVLGRELEGSCKRNEPLCNHTSFRIGGPAALWVEANSLADVRVAHEATSSRGLDLTVLGRGTNFLVSDTGYDGLCLTLGPRFRDCAIDSEQASLQAGAGALLGRLVQEAQQAALTGLEFATGIPGTFGGALAGNAGTRDEWIGSLVRAVTTYSPAEGLRLLRGDEITFSYRCSSLRDNATILDARLSLRPGAAPAIAARVKGALTRRKATQPLFLPNAGSIFRNPAGALAAELIEGVGMKGARSGDAQVSELHANFIVNHNAAQARDVMKLMQEIRDKVLNSYDIELKPEIRFLGAFDEY